MIVPYGYPREHLMAFKETVICLVSGVSLAIIIEGVGFSVWEWDSVDGLAVTTEKISE